VIGEAGHLPCFLHPSVHETSGEAVPQGTKVGDLVGIFIPDRKFNLIEFATENPYPKEQQGAPPREPREEHLEYHPFEGQ
jgi:hypothetical protein